MENAMRYATWIIPALICQGAFAQEDLPAQLAGAQGRSLDQLQDLQARLAASPATPEQKAYHEAYLAYCFVNQTRESDPRRAEALLDRTMKALESRRDPESMALLGACLGHKLGFAPMTAMELAPRALGLFAEAGQRAPGSPRVLLLHGVHILHTPAFYGGGAERALPLLLGAVRAATAEVPAKDPWAPRWGNVESLAWLAMAQGELGQFTEAEATLAAARALDPAHGLLYYATKRVQACRAGKGK
jgi:tetratricopeptide (TPR) repeat protein